MITGRELRRNEIELVWTLDRRELIDASYHVVTGELVLMPESCEVVEGWPQGEAEEYTPILLACRDHGGWAYGLFEGGDGGRLVGAAVLDGRFIGPTRDHLQLAFLHVSQPYRHRGLGRQLFDLAAAAARERDADHLYISATPSEHTVDFYLDLGCTLIVEPDPGLFAREPEDIHLEFGLD